MKVRINSMSLCFDVAYCLYAETDFGLHMTRDRVDAYYMHAKVFFCVSMHDFFDVIFIRELM